MIGSKARRQVAMATELAAIVDASQELRRSHGGRVVAEGSKAEAELRELGIDVGPPNALTEAYGQGLKAIAAAEDFIGGAVDLAGRPERSFSTMVVLRGAAEASAQAFWFLDPSIDRGEREARAMGSLRDSIGAARRFARKGRISFTEPVGSDLDALEANVAAHRGSIRGLPSWEKLLRQLTRTLQLEDRLSDAGLEALSNAAHSMKDARDQVVADWDEDGNPVLRSHLATEWGYLGMSSDFGPTVLA